MTDDIETQDAPPGSLTTIDPKAASQKFDPEMLAAIREQVLQELQSKDEKERLQQRVSREAAKKATDDYVATMKESSEPWVDIQGWVETSEGVNVELEWNDAFVQHLRGNGVTGADEEQVVQQWVTLLLRDMADRMSGKEDKESEFE